MSDLSPSTQFHRLVKPPFVHGLLHQLCLQQMTRWKTITTPQIQEKSVTNHLHALHQRQTNGLVTGQADDTGRSVRRGLHQGDHCLDPQPTALKTGVQTAKINAPSPISLYSIYSLSIYWPRLCLLSTHGWAEARKHACYHWGRAMITTSDDYPQGLFWCCVSGVCWLTSILSKADGVPPRWTWPSTVSLVS